ncbi:MAG: sugar transferase [Myxococcales bacterium]|nr:sugar transferase [Myxococcales bacterium]
MRRPLQRALKRAFDIASCGSIALALAPVFPLIALVVKLESDGPVFFIQERAGKDAKPFKIYKFRTMTQAPPNHDPTKWSEAEVVRITRIGNIMRDFGIDELPQLYNILKGDMSVIGPRPPLLAQAEAYGPRERRMFDMRPGVLSLAAIKGRRSLSVEDRIRYHVEYVDNWSLLLDLEILLSSLFVVLGREHAAERIPA